MNNWNRVIALILCYLILVSLCGCSQKKEIVVESDVANNQYDKNMESDKGIQQTDTDAFPIFLSIDELINEINNGPVLYENSINESVDLYDIEFFYALEEAPAPGYYLCSIEVWDACIVFCYAPENDQMGVNSRNLIAVTYTREDKFPGCFDEFLDNGELTEDGYIYNVNNNKIYMPVGDSCVDIQVPDSMNNYETIKEMCKFNKIIVEDYKEECQGGGSVDNPLAS